MSRKKKPLSHKVTRSSPPNHFLALAGELVLSRACIEKCEAFCFFVGGDKGNADLSGVTITWLQVRGQNIITPTPANTVAASMKSGCVIIRACSKNMDST